VKARSVNSIPAELHGSTPDEIANSNDSNLPASSNVRNSLKRASFRRSYFAKTFNDPTLYTPPLASPVPELELLQIQPSAEHTLARSPSNRSLPTPQTPHKTTRSFDSARPHSHLPQDRAHPPISAKCSPRSPKRLSSVTIQPCQPPTSSQYKLRSAIMPTPSISTNILVGVRLCRRCCHTC
jgi:hypothetical protein